MKGDRVTVGQIAARLGISIESTRKALNQIEANPVSTVSDYAGGFAKAPNKTPVFDASVIPLVRRAISYPQSGKSG